MSGIAVNESKPSNKHLRKSGLPESLAGAPLADKLSPEFLSDSGQTETSYKRRSGTKKNLGNILIVDASGKLFDEIVNPLSTGGFHVEIQTELAGALEAIASHSPDVVVAELTPGDNAPLGLSAAIRCQTQFDRISIFFLVSQAMCTEQIQLECLAAGADDVITRPVRIPVVIAHLQAAIRLSRAQSMHADVYQVGGLRVDHRQRKAWASNEEMQLTPSEYEILRRLVQSPGKVFERAELVGTSRTSDPLACARTIDVHVSSLRRKLGTEGQRITTVKGEGYCVVPEQPDADA